MMNLNAGRTKGGDEIVSIREKSTNKKQQMIMKKKEIIKIEKEDHLFFES